MCKNFIQNIGLKQHITAVHEERDSIVINVAKLLLEDAIWKCSWKKLWIQLWSLWQKFHQSFHESEKTLDWNYKLQLFMKIKRFNFDQCAKNFARGSIWVIMKLIHEFNCEHLLFGFEIKKRTHTNCSWRCFEFP